MKSDEFGTRKGLLGLRGSYAIERKNFGTSSISLSKLTLYLLIKTPLIEVHKHRKTVFRRFFKDRLASR